MEAAATPNARRKRVRATEEKSLTTPSGSVVTFEVDPEPVGGDNSKDERKARLAFNRQTRCRALQDHAKNKALHAKAGEVRRQHLPRACFCLSCGRSG